jgi:hypothetical protein
MQWLAVLPVVALHGRTRRGGGDRAGRAVFLPPEYEPPDGVVVPLPLDGVTVGRRRPCGRWSTISWRNATEH